MLTSRLSVVFCDVFCPDCFIGSNLFDENRFSSHWRLKVSITNRFAILLRSRTRPPRPTKKVNGKVIPREVFPMPTLQKYAVFSSLFWITVAVFFTNAILSSAAYGGTKFYFDLASYNAAVTAAGLSPNSINFESAATIDYSTAAGLSTGGLTFVGPFSPGYKLSVKSESDWTGKFIVSGTGNTLVGVGEIDVTLPPNTRAFGANVGQSAVRVVGINSAVRLQLSTGENALSRPRHRGRFHS